MGWIDSHARTVANGAVWHKCLADELGACQGVESLKVSLDHRALDDRNRRLGISAAVDEDIVAGAGCHLRVESDMGELVSARKGE